MRRILEIVLLLALTLLAPGFWQGYRSPQPYILFTLLNLLLLTHARLLMRHFFPPDGPEDGIIRMAVLSFAIIVLAELALGAIGWLTPFACLMLLAILLLPYWFLHPQVEPQASSSLSPLARPRGLALLLLSLLFAVSVFTLSFGMTHLPARYDSLTYHLFFPATWLQDGRIEIIPTPFGDQAPAYAPSNGELFFLWLMLPFHGDLLARVGQFPFYLLGALTLYSLARRLGQKPEHALFAALFFLLSKPVVSQATGGDVDLVLCATFLTTVYFGTLAARSRRSSDFFLLGISLGLYLGTKFVALIYLPLLLISPWVVAGLPSRIAWALPGAAALAFPWYLRNWLIAGSPLYPASLEIAGITLIQGAYSLATMSNSPFHATQLSFLPTVVTRAFGTGLFLFWCPFAALGTFAFLKERNRWPAAFVLLMPFLMVPFFWWGIPYNTAARFLFPAVSLAMLSFSYALEFRKGWERWLRGVYTLGTLWLILGTGPEIGLPGQIMTNAGILNLRYLLPFLVLTLLVFWGLGNLRLKISSGVAGAFAFFCAASTGTFVLSMRACPGEGCRLIRAESSPIPQEMFPAWDWINRESDHANIAYTGNNIPYRLLGEKFKNRVSYVNIDQHLGWRFHDYDLATRKRPGYKPPDTPKPAYDREEKNYEAWVRNLETLSIDFLFVSVLSPNEAKYLWQDEEGFPIEQAWAHSHPETFVLVYHNPKVKIYKRLGI